MEYLIHVYLFSVYLSVGGRMIFCCKIWLQRVVVIKADIWFIIMLINFPLVQPWHSCSISSAPVFAITQRNIGVQSDEQISSDFYYFNYQIISDTVIYSRPRDQTTNSSPPSPTLSVSLTAELHSDLWPHWTRWQFWMTSKNHISHNTTADVLPLSVLSLRHPEGQALGLAKAPIVNLYCIELELNRTCPNWIE